MKEPYMKQFQWLLLTLFTITTIGLNAMNKEASAPITIEKTKNANSMQTIDLNTALVAQVVAQQEDPSYYSTEKASAEDHDSDLFEEHTMKACSYEGSPAGDYYALKAHNAKRYNLKNKKK